MAAIRNVAPSARSRAIRSGLKKVIRAKDASAKQVLDATVLLCRMNEALSLTDAEYQEQTDNNLARLVSLAASEPLPGERSEGELAPEPSTDENLQRLVALAAVS